MGGSGSSGGKKGLAQGQQDLQSQQFGLAKQQLGTANAALAPSTSFWDALLKGGQAAVQATGPIASQLGQSASGTTQAIQASTPRGGEQNLAIAQNYNQLGNNVSRLYSGMQPAAAQGLAQNAAALFGSAGQFNPFANIGAAEQAQAGSNQMKGQTGAGLGQLAYKGGQSANAGKIASTAALAA